MIKISDVYNSTAATERGGGFYRDIIELIRKNDSRHTSTNKGPAMFQFELKHPLSLNNIIKPMAQIEVIVFASTICMESTP